VLKCTNIQEFQLICDKKAFEKRRDRKAGRGKMERSKNPFGESGKIVRDEAFWSNVRMTEELEEEKKKSTIMPFLSANV